MLNVTFYVVEQALRCLREVPVLPKFLHRRSSSCRKKVMSPHPLAIQQLNQTIFGGPPADLTVPRG